MVFSDFMISQAIKNDEKIAQLRADIGALEAERDKLRKKFYVYVRGHHNDYNDGYSAACFDFLPACPKCGEREKYRCWDRVYFEGEGSSACTPAEGHCDRCGYEWQEHAGDDDYAYSWEEIKEFKQKAEERDTLEADCRCYEAMRDGFSERARDYENKIATLTAEIAWLTDPAMKCRECPFNLTVERDALKNERDNLIILLRTWRDILQKSDYKFPSYRVTGQAVIDEINRILSVPKKLILEVDTASERERNKAIAERDAYRDLCVELVAALEAANNGYCINCSNYDTTPQLKKECRHGSNLCSVKKTIGQALARARALLKKEVK